MLADILRRICQQTSGDIFQVKDLVLKRNQPQNLQKLRYWGFITKVGDPTGHGGTWRITQAGRSFLAGASAPKQVRTYRGEPYEYSEQKVTIGQVMRKTQTRPEYAQGALPI